LDVWDDGEGTRWVGGDDTTIVKVPGVLKYLDVELAAMGIKMKYSVGPKTVR
jgi:DNA-directed RNA polymerase I subunit RPA2